MDKRKIIAILALVAIVCLTLGVASNAVYAQNDSDESKKSDKRLAAKSGVGGSLADGSEGDEEEKDGPTKFQMWLGVGSCAVMWIVIKWL